MNTTKNHQPIMIRDLTAAIGHERQADLLTRAEASRRARAVRQARGVRASRWPNLGSLLTRAHGLTTRRPAVSAADGCVTPAA